MEGVKPRFVFGCCLAFSKRLAGKIVINVILFFFFLYEGYTMLLKPQFFLYIF